MAKVTTKEEAELKKFYDKYLKPQLATKFENEELPGEYTLSQKLDGNRCMAFFYPPANAWKFMSRSGKVLKISYDMEKFLQGVKDYKNYAYDGEIISDEQFAQKEQIRKVRIGELDKKDIDPSLVKIKKKLQYVTGKLGSDIADKSDLKFMIFDCFDIKDAIRDFVYSSRRQEVLDKLQKVDNQNIKILEILSTHKIQEISKDAREEIKRITNEVVSLGGEGIMINDNNANYYHSKHNQDRKPLVQKSKKFGTMDMEVVALNMGASVNKVIHEELVKDFKCVLKNKKGEIVSVNVWNGIVDYFREELELKGKIADLNGYVTKEFPELTSDIKNLTLYLKEKFSQHPEKIIGKIVEVQYFDKTQNKKTEGTNEYSVTQPRIMRIRDDKTALDTSEF